MLWFRTRSVVSDVRIRARPNDTLPMSTEYGVLRTHAPGGHQPVGKEETRGEHNVRDWGWVRWVVFLRHRWWWSILGATWFAPPSSLRPPKGSFCSLRSAASTSHDAWVRIKRCVGDERELLLVQYSAPRLWTNVTLYVRSE